MKKFLSYICTFVLMFFMSAAVTVWSSSLENKGSITPPVTIGGASSSSLFTGILESIQEEKKISVNGQITIKQENSDDLPLDININLDMTDSNNLKVDGFVSFELFEQLNIIKFSYYDFCIYFSYKDINLKIEQSTLIGFAGALSSLLPEQVSSLDMNAMIEQLLPTIMGALDQIQEEKLENGDTLASLNIEDFVSAKILTDSDGVLKSLDLKTGYFKGFAVEGYLNVSFDDLLVIEDPENPSVEGLRKEYYDIEKIVNILDNTTKLDNLFANINIDVDSAEAENNVEFNVLANIKDNNYSVNLLNNSFGYVNKLYVAYLNQSLYANINDIYVLANEKLISEVASLFSNQNIVGSIDTKELQESAINILSTLKTSLTQDINNIFDLIRHLSLKNNTIKLVLNGEMLGIGKEEVELSLGFNDEIITSLVVNGIEISGQTINLSIDLEQTEEKVAVENTDKYTDLYQIYAKNKDLLTSEQLDINVEFEYNEHLIQGNVKLNTDLSYVEANITYSNKTIYLLLDGSDAYVTIDNIKIKIDTERVKDLISEYIDIEELMGSVNLQEELDKTFSGISIKDLISVISKVESISFVNGNISVKADLSELGLEGITELYVHTQDSLLKSISLKDLKYQDNQINATINLSGTSFEKTVINKNEYLDLVKFVESTIAIKDLREGSAYLDAKVNYKEKEYDIYLSALANLDQEYLKVGLTLSDFNINIDASLYNNTAYVKLNNMYMQLAERDISEILKLLDLENVLSGQEGLNVNELLENNKLVSNMYTFISNLSIKDLDKIKRITINNSTILITIDKSVFGSDEDLTLKLTIVKGELRSVEISQLEIAEDLSIRFNLALYRNTVQKQEVEEDRYLKVKNAIEQVVNNINKTQISLNLDINAIINNDNYGLNVNAKLDLVKKYLEAGLKVNELEGVDVNAILYNEKAFVNINDIFLKLGLSDINQLIGLFGETQENQTQDIVSGLSDIEIINSIQSYINNISIQSLKDLEISIEYNTIKLPLDKTVLDTEKDIILTISILGNNQFGISLSEIEIKEGIAVSASGVIDFNEFEVKTIDEEKYLDVLQTVEQIKQLTEIREGTISAVANANVDGKKYNLSFNLDANLDVNYYNLNLALKGAKNFKLNFNYYDNLAYANIQNIFVKLDLQEIHNILERLGINIKLEGEMSFSPEMLLDAVKDYQIVESLTAFIDNLSLDSLKMVKTLSVTSSAITVIVDKQVIGSSTDLKVVISLNNGRPVSVEVFKFDVDKNIDLTFKINLYQKSVSPELISSNNYLDVAKLINNTLNIENEENISINGFANVYNLDYIKQFGVDLEISKLLENDELSGTLLLNAFYNNEYYKLDTTLLGQDLFLQLANLNLVVDIDQIQGQINNILSKLNIDASEVDKYLTPIIGLINNQSTLSDIINLFNVSIGEVSLSSNAVDGIDIIGLLSQLIENVKIDNAQISVNLGKDLFGLANDINVNVGISNNKLTLIDVNNLSIQDNIIDCEINLEYDKLEAINKPEGEFIKVTDLYNLFDATYNTVKNGTISGQVTLKFDFLNESHTVLANYGLRIIDGEIELKLSTTFKGLDVNVYFVNNTIYLEIVGLKMFIEFAELDNLFDWIATNFGVEIDIDVNTIESYLDMVKNFDLQSLTSGMQVDVLGLLGFINSFKLEDYISSLTIGQTKTEIDFVGGVSFDVTYKELGSEANFVTDLYLEYNEMSMDVDCTAFTSFDLGLEEKEYIKYSEILPIIDSVVNTISSKQYKVGVDANLVKDNKTLYDINASMSLDLLNGLGANIFLEMTGLQNIDLKVDYYDQMLYVNYDSLKVGISKSAIQELIGVITGLLGLDDTMSGLVGDVVNNEASITNENLESIIPNLDLDNPLNMLKYINSINATSNSISVSIKGEFLSSPKPLTISIVVEDGKVDQLQVIDIYSNGEFYNISLNFEEFAGIERLSNEAEYIDISDSPELVKALVNTSELDDYHIKGTINLAIGLGSLQLDAASVEVDIQIKLDNNNKPIVYVEIGNYPLIGSVNNKNTNAIGGIDSVTMRERKIYIYYQDGWCYLRTNDENTKLIEKNNNEYDRVTKVPLNYVFNNISYYMQWLLGFTDSIQTEIDNAIIDSMKSTEEIDLSNVLLSYEKKDGYHRIEVNLQEISRNPDLGSLVVYLSTINNESTGNKDYLYELGIEMYMLDDFLILKTDEDDMLYLVDIGKELDFTNINAYINNYAYNPYAEFTKEGKNSSYKQTNTNTSTITVNKNNGEQIDYYTGLAGQTFNPVNPTYITDDGICKTTYKFIGYYDDNGKLFTQKYFGVNNVNLTAKWEVEEVIYYRTITLINNSNVQTIKALAGQTVTLPSYSTLVEDKTDGIYTTTFLGWFDSQTNGNKVSYTTMPDQDTTIYAVYNTSVRKYVYVTYNLGGVAQNYQTRYLENEIATLVAEKDYSFVDGNVKTTYFFINWYTDNTYATLSQNSFEITQNVEVFAKWDVQTFEAYMIEVYDNGQLVMQESVTYVEGQNIPFTSNVKVLDGVKWYTDASYTNLYAESKDVVMPRQNLTLHIRNKYSLTVISNYGNVVNQTYSVYQGESLSQYLTSQSSYMIEVANTSRTYYNFGGYNNTSSVMTNANLTVTANWSIEVWYCVSFKTDTTGLSSANKGVSTVNPVWVKEGETLDLSQIKATCEYKWALSTWTCKFKGWKLDGDSVSEIVVTGAVTLEASWGTPLIK